MKKIIFFCISLIFLMPNVKAEPAIPNGNPPSEKIPATLVKCDSISNVWLKYNDEVKRIHLIAYDSEDGALNKEINDYFCKVLTEANKIEIEYDIESTDKYNRELIFVYVNDILIQENLISKGYGQVNFVKGNYKHLDELCTVQKNAIIEGIGIWSYPKIEEKYCNSGVEIGSKESIQEQSESITTNKDNKVLQNLLFINSGILLLLLFFRRNS